MNKAFLYLHLLLIVLPSCKTSSLDDMVYIEGETLTTFKPYTSVPVEIEVAPFYIDKNLVTYSQFKDFAKDFNYKTDAEKFGNSIVFNYQTSTWKMIEGINYHYPITATLRALPNHPVTQVSWNDANYYCACHGKRLPTDVEWELAAKNGDGQYNKKYSWGDQMKADGQYKANYWQGNFPKHNTQDDGFKYTSPVGYFGETPIGLTDMGGNVWQWCFDNIQPTAAEALTDTATRKVMRGGSFLCDPMVCHGFHTLGRSSNTPESASCHAGFRCVKDVK